MPTRRIHLECKMQKQGCYQNHGNEEWVRMRNIPMKFLSKRSQCYDIEKRGLISESHDKKPTSEEDIYLLLLF
jgi:hypothetical protein